MLPEAATAVKSGVCAMHSVAEGGIFGALWEMAAGAGVGLEIDLKKIPVRQETIEICEYFEINPYETASGGCLLMVADKGYDLVRKLEKEHIPAQLIAKTTASRILGKQLLFSVFCQKARSLQTNPLAGYNIHFRLYPLDGWNIAIRQFADSGYGNNWMPYHSGYIYTASRYLDF